MGSNENDSEDDEAKEDEIDDKDDNGDDEADGDMSRKVVSREVDILTRAQSAISSLIAYRDAVDPDAEDAVVPQLHRDVTECISNLYDKRDFKVMNNAVHGGIREELVEVSFLSRALDDMIHGARKSKGLRALLNSGVRCHWVPPTPPKAVSIVVDAPSLTELRSSLPALQEAVFDKVIPNLERKLKAGELYPTNRNITHNAITAPATFDVQVSAHCEVALISHLASRNIPTTLYIASALPACYACHLLVESMEELQGYKTFQLGPYNGVIDCGWEFPSALPHADAVQKTMLRKLNDQLKEIIDRYQRPKKPYVEEEWGSLPARELWGSARGTRP